MVRKHLAHRLVLCEALGFAALITVAWLNELIGLPALLFGGTASGNLREAAMETAVILAVALPTMSLTFALSRRLYYLEGFVRVCAWCRKVRLEEQWVPMEQFFDRKLNAKTSHGMCPDCAAKFKQDLKQGS